MRAAAAAAALGATRCRALVPLPLPHALPSARRRAAAAAAAAPTPPPPPPTKTTTTITLLAAGERGTRLLARLLARDRRAGDCFFLRGAVGAGKSAFSRAFVRAAAGDPYLPVPSPTFLLLNTYEVGGGGPSDGNSGGNGTNDNNSPPAAPPIHHFDLYRLDPAKTSPAELVRLDIPGALASGVALVEWPERLVEIAAAAAAAGAGSGSAASITPSSSTPPLLSALVPRSRVDVYVDPLADDDPARAVLAEALGGGGSACGAGGRLRAAPLCAPPAAEDEEEDEDDDDDDDDEDDNPYVDRRWRRWTLAPTSEEWEARLHAVLREARPEARRRRRRPGDGRGGGEGGGSGRRRDDDEDDGGGLFLVE